MKMILFGRIAIIGIAMNALGGQVYAQYGGAVASPNSPMALILLRRSQTDQVVDKGEFGTAVQNTKKKAEIKDQAPIFVRPSLTNTAASKLQRCDELSRKVMDALRISDKVPSGLQEEFSSECMQDLLVAPAGTELTDLQQKLASILGSLKAGDGKPFCTAFRVNDEMVMTAKHCLYKRDSGARIQWPDVLKFQLAGSKDAFEIKAATCLPGISASCDFPQSVSPFSTKGEFLIFKVPGLAHIEMPKVEFSENAVQDEPVLLAGISDDLGLERKYLFDAAPGGCKVGISQDGCIYHSCSTGRGYSGAPLIRLTTSSNPAIAPASSIGTGLPAARSTGRTGIVVLGMHIEGVGVKGSQCNPQAMRGTGNAAIPINQSQITATTR